MFTTVRHTATVTRGRLSTVTVVRVVTACHSVDLSTVRSSTRVAGSAPLKDAAVPSVKVSRDLISRDLTRVISSCHFLVNHW